MHIQYTVSTVQYCTVQYDRGAGAHIQYCTVQYSTVQDTTHIDIQDIDINKAALMHVSTVGTVQYYSAVHMHTVYTYTVQYTCIHNRHA